MARYRKIDVRMYGDEKFRELSKPLPNAQSLWVYLLTGPHTTNVPGLFVAGESGMSEALAWPLKAFQKAFAEISAKEMAKADWNARVVWIPNAVSYNPPENPNVVTGWRRSWDEIPECPLKRVAVEKLRVEVFSLRDAKGTFREAFREAFRKAFPEAFGKPFRKQEQEQEQEQEHVATRERLSKEPDALRRNCLDLFDQWSQVSRAKPLMPEENEHTPIFNLITACSQRPAISRGTEVVEQHTLIPFATEICIKNSKEFKHIGYAVKTVGNMISEWAQKGIPGVKPANGVHNLPRRRMEDMKDTVQED